MRYSLVGLVLILTLASISKLHQPAEIRRSSPEHSLLDSSKSFVRIVESEHFTNNNEDACFFITNKDGRDISRIVLHHNTFICEPLMTDDIKFILAKRPKEVSAGFTNTNYRLEITSGNDKTLVLQISKKDGEEIGTLIITEEGIVQNDFHDAALGIQ